MLGRSWEQPSWKRGRDEDGDVAIGGTEGFTEHRNKRLQTLPFRVSPSSKRLTIPAPSFNPRPMTTPLDTPQAPHTITPSDAHSEDAKHLVAQANKTRLSAWTSTSSRVVMSQVADDSAFRHAPDMVDGYRTHHVVDMDIDMDGAESDALLPPSQPGSAQAGAITSRMPTPIHCSFAVQVRGTNWGGAAGNVIPSSGSGKPVAERTAPRSLDQTAVADWNVVRNRRLPSPISESSGEEAALSTVMVDSHCRPGMRLPRAASAMDLTLPVRSLSALSTASHKTGESTLKHVGVTGCTQLSSSGHAMEVDLLVAPSPKKGHSRSRHTINSWTQVPGMKKTFSIGYRADCEKCRQKVPGHFNHIIVS